MKLAVLGFLLLRLVMASSDIEGARDRQDRPALEALVRNLSEAARKSPNDPGAHYRLALARSYLAEVALELGDKAGAREAAEAGVREAERAVALQGNFAEYQRILGTLCGQVVPANALLALKYGRCALESVNKALELDPKSSDAYLSRGVGNYYLPAALGGGVELAIRDFQEAIRLNPKSAEAHLWLGIALRKMERNVEARAALKKSLEFNPNRLWAKQQLEKTPAK
jgi:tetratricopeptide (TPR) repeat protein